MDLRAVSRSALCLPLIAVGGCFAPPGSDGSGDTGGGTDGPPATDGAPYETGAATGSATWWGTDESGADDEPGSSDSASPGTVGVSASDSDSDSGVDPSDTGTGPRGEFPPPEVFGDDIRELDLVGNWTMPWSPEGVPDVQISVGDDGSFTWTERRADCSVVGAGSGVLWVEGTQLVFHVESWDKRVPWDPAPVIGEPVEVPMRLRLGYSPMGQYIGLAAPTDLTAVVDWGGHSYDRRDLGTGPAGDWVAEAELWALVAGEAEPQLIVRDRWSLSLPPADQAEAIHERTWWWPGGAPQPEFRDEASGPWADDTPGNIAGAATVRGETYAYDAVHMFSFAANRSFKLGVVSDCE